MPFCWHSHDTVEHSAMAPRAMGGVTFCTVAMLGFPRV